MKKRLNILLIILVLCLGGYIAYDKILSNDIEKSKEEQEEIIITEDFNLVEAEHLLEKFGFKENLGCKSTVLDVSYKDEFKVITALKNIDKTKMKKVSCNKLFSGNETISGGKYYKTKYGACPKNKEVDAIPYKEANQIYKSMYGTDLAKLGVSGTTVTGQYYQFYEYVASIDSFVKLECAACDGTCAESYTVSKIKSAKITGDTLLIDVYYLHGTPIYNNTTHQSIFRIETSKISENSISKNVEEFEKEVEKDYLDKLDVYEIEFEKNGDNFIFKSLIKQLS